MTDAIPTPAASCSGCLRGAFAAVVITAGVVAAPSAGPPGSAAQQPHYRLTGTDESTSGTALILGPSMISTPSAEYAQTVTDLYLAPHGFTGSSEVLTTPESPYYLDSSMSEGAKIVTDRINELIESGQVDAEHPVTVFGYSQSAALTTYAMQQLHEAGVPSEDVHFVLVGDSANPNGGMLVGFEGLPGLSELLENNDVTLGNATPSDLYPTDIYTLEYDGFADFPRYPINILADLNAFAGLTTQHLAYLGLTPEQLADAETLETTGDSLVTSHMIHSEYLPLLFPLLLTPVIGKPLYDLLEPDMRTLVNLGYGSIDHGWNDGPADVATQFSLGAPDVDWSEVEAALAAGAEQGWSDFNADLLDPATYQFTLPVDDPALSTLLSAASGSGIAGEHPASLADVFNALLNTIAGSLIGVGMVAPTSELPQSVSELTDVGGSQLFDAATLFGA